MFSEGMLWSCLVPTGIFKFFFLIVIILPWQIEQFHNTKFSLLLCFYEGDTPQYMNNNIEDNPRKLCYTQWPYKFCLTVKKSYKTSLGVGGQGENKKNAG